MKPMPAVCTLVILTGGPGALAQQIDTLEDIGVDWTPVASRTIDGVRVTLGSSVGAPVAATYCDEDPYLFSGSGACNDFNDPLRPSEVSGDRCIGRIEGLLETAPYTFDFDQPVAAFGLTSIDLLEEFDSAGNDAFAVLRAFDASGRIVAEHSRTGPHGQSGLDLDWTVETASAVIVSVEFTGYSETARFHALDDLFVARTPRCPGDFNWDGAVNTLDVLAFLNAWAAGEDDADFNGDGEVNTLDVLAFLNAWNAGCP